MKAWHRNFLLILISFFIQNYGYAKPEWDRRFQKVIYIVLENRDHRDVMKNQSFRNWARQGASLNRFFAATHPSQPNYIAMVAGDTLGVTNNSNVNLNHRHLGDLLEGEGLDWKVYAEGYPGNCYLKSTAKDYARKHVPFLSFRNIQNNPSRCAKIVNFNQFRPDWESNQLPDFSMVIPNNKNNSHDTTIETSARWIRNHFGNLLSNSEIMKDTLVIITYDEGSYNLNNQIYTVFLGESVIPGVINNQRHTHYSLIRMLQEEWELPSLGRKDQHAPIIGGIWK